jgi:hypothetical protein
VHLERQWRTMDWSVWLYDRVGHRQLAMYHIDADGTMKHELVDANATFPDAPTFRLPPEALEALLREASNVLPASDATVAHLADAVATRDRLLALVETGWTAA